MITANPQLDDVFHALADATRRGILLQVRECDLSVNEIAARFSISLPAVSKHLGVLERAGLISRRKEGRKRICHVIPERLATATEWLDFYTALWSDNLDNLKRFVEQDSPPPTRRTEHE